MRVIDFLFYYLALNIRKANDRFGYRRIDEVAMSGCTLSIFTTVWIIFIDFIIEFLMFHVFKSKIPAIYFVLIGVGMAALFNYLYFEIGRYKRIYDREHSDNPKFAILDQTGIIIAIIYVYGSLPITMLSSIIFHNI